MQISKKNRILLATILTTLFLLSSIATIMPVKAQEMQNPNTAGGPLPDGTTPSVVMEGDVYLSFSPNPIGVGQELLVNVWSIPAPGANRAHTGYTVTFTKPDGSKDVIGPFNSFVADGTNWFTYIPDQAGEWEVQFTYPGDYYPEGRYVNGVYNNSAPAGASFMDQRDYPSTWYTPQETPVMKLVVQENWVSSWPSAGEPTDYWTRPISPENREWSSIGGNYPYSYYNTMTRYNGPFITGPNTSHIVWKQQKALAGMIGGEAGTYSIAAQPSTPSVIYLGRCYETLTTPVNGVPTSCAVCYDLRTGEQYYAIPGGITPTAIAYVSPSAVAGIGSVASGSFTVDLLTISGGASFFGPPTAARLYKINPYTGAVTLNMSLPAGVSSSTIYNNGLVLSTQTIGSGANATYRLINWTTAGSSTNFATRIFSNISWPSNMAPGSQGMSADFETGVAVGTVAGIYGAASGGAAVTGGDFGLASGAFGTRIVGISIVTGQVLYNFTTEDTSFQPGSNSYVDGKILIPMDMGILNCYDLLTGRLVWQSHEFDYPWGAFGGYNAEGAYGLYYWQTYDGLVAFNVSTGQRAWKYQYPAPPFETPYTMENGTSQYAFYGAAQVADGKIYVYNTEHSQSYPITRGWRIHCVDALTGEGIWNITGSMQPGAISDGYLTAGNAYDGYMYVFGKGPSKTTVTAPNLAVTAGTSAVITGTVTDMSPGQEGAACVSKESMTEWMEYLHMQKAIPANVIGVPISIDAVDPNGNSVHVADVTSDMSGTFSYTWTPTIAGDYKIMASFMGDDSYGSSWAQTYATVAEAPDTSPAATPTAIANPPYELYTIGVGIAIIIAIAIAVLLLRKKP